MVGLKNSKYLRVVVYVPGRVKGQTAIFEEMIEDEEGLVDDRLPTTSRGLWAASETERTLKAVLSFAKAKRLDPQIVEEGNTFMELFENWKKEYKVLYANVQQSVKLNKKSWSKYSVVRACDIILSVSY